MKTTHDTLIGALIGAAVFAVVLGLGPMSASSASGTAKSAGFVSYLLLWASVVLGLLSTTRIMRGHLKPATVLSAHQYLSQMALAFTAFHALMFLGVKGPFKILVPFAAGPEIALGQLAFPLLAALVSTSLMRRQVGNRAWRLVHLSAFATYIMALAHSALLEHEIGLYVITSALVVYLVAVRVVTATSLALATGTHSR